MAEAAAPEPVPWASKVQCRYYLHGVCREGPNCRYSHDRGDAPSNVCRFYAKGNCTYADRCRYDHVKPKQNGPKSSPSALASSKDVLSSVRPPPITNLPSIAHASRMVTLKKHNSTGESFSSDSLPTSPTSQSGTYKDPEKWVKAAEFVPGKPYMLPAPSSYASATKTGTDDMCGEIIIPAEAQGDTSKLLCPFAAGGECYYGVQCAYTHGDICDICGMAMLNPHDKDQREAHRKECISVLETDMELSFAIARSKDKACGICMDVVMDKQPACEQRFGIMSNCNHVFCLACIRKWRSNKQFDNKIIRSCPECRVVSDFVTPSKYWVDTREEKDKLIEDYKKALSAKPCRYFDQGRGECPFNDKCFYLHAYPDGRRAEPQPRRRRRRTNAEGDLDLLQQIILWDFLEERQNRVLLELELAEELENLLSLAAADFLSESSDSDFEEMW